MMKAFPPERSIRSRDTDYTTYFAYAVELNRVKIGVTITTAQKRVREIEIASPCAISLLGTITGHSLVERQLHAMFMAYHVRGEWFRHEGELRRLIEADPIIVPHDPNYRWVRAISVSPEISVPVQTFMAKLSWLTPGSEKGAIARAMGKSVRQIEFDLEQSFCLTEAEFVGWRENFGDSYERTVNWFEENRQSVPTRGTTTAGLAVPVP